MTPEQLLAEFARLSNDDKDLVREGMGNLCLWCLRPADRLCDGPVFRERVPGGRLEPYSRLHEHGDESTCSAPVCRACSTSKEFHGILCFRGRAEAVEDSSDRCPYCAALDLKVTRVLREEHRMRVRDHARAAREQRGML